MTILRKNKTFLILILLIWGALLLVGVQAGAPDPEPAGTVEDVNSGEVTPPETLGVIATSSPTPTLPLDNEVSEEIEDTSAPSPKQSTKPKSPGATKSHQENDSGEIDTLNLGDLASGSFLFSVDEDFSAYGFQWESGSFTFSWDGINYQSPTLLGEHVRDNYAGQKATNLYFGAPDSKKLYIKTGRVSDLKLSLITPTESDDGFGIAAGVADYMGATYTELPIISRAQWGADESKALWDPSYGPIQRIIVHHTAGSNSASNWDAVVRSIFNYHAVTLDWGDIGYNYLIAPNGNIYEGRKGGEGATAAHTYLHNYGSIGIAMIGTYSSVPPSSAAMDSLKRLIAEKSAVHNIDTVTWQSNYYGHRDWNSTTCPGTTLYGILPNKANWINSHQDSQYPEVFAARAAAELAYDAANPFPTPQKTDLVITFDRPFTVSEAEIQAMIPPYSGIKVSGVFGNKVHLTLIKYYDGGSQFMDFRSKLLRTLFSLDGEVKDIEYVGDFFIFDENLGTPTPTPSPSPTP